MSKWLRVDGTSGDVIVQKTLVYQPGAAGHFTFEFDIVFPAATLTALAAGSVYVQPDELFSPTGQTDGIYMQKDSGVWNFHSDHGVTPTAQSIQPDTSYHVKLTPTNTTSIHWSTTLEVDGVVVSTVIDNAFGDPSTQGLSAVNVGAFYTSGDNPLVFYIDNVVVKDGSGSTLFSDDFESGGTSNWTSVDTSGGGSVTVVDFTPGGGGSTPPTNTDCASAISLTGCTGTATGDNSAWAGTWPTGQDPLFNSEGVGGGAPMWWKWTNTASGNMLFRFQVTAAPGNRYNAGIAAGSCGTLDMSASPVTLFFRNVEGGNVSDEYSGSDVSTTGSPSYFDIVIAPGHTAYVEIDSWSPGQTTDPPSPAGHTGVFTFDWWAYNYTTRDSTQGDGQTAHSTLLADVFAPTSGTYNASGVIKPFETLEVGGRLYMIWKAAEQYNDSIYVGDCALDGTGLTTQRIFQQATSPGSYPTNDIPRLHTDGTDVFATYGAWLEKGTETDTSGVGYTGGGSSYPNPDFPDSCSARIGGQAFCFGEGAATTADTFRYDVWRFAGAGSWTLLHSIGQDHDKTVGFVPDMSTISGASSAIDPDIVARAHVVGGVVWVHAAYLVVRAFQSFHFNDFPLAGTPPGSIYVTNDHLDIYEYADTYTVALDGTCVLVNRVENHVAEVQHWTSDDPTIDPAFGNWQTFADGNWVTDSHPSTHYTSIRYHPTACELRCDEGYPIFAHSRQTYTNNVSGAAGSGFTDNDVRLIRLDTGSSSAAGGAVATYTYNNMAAGHDTNTGVYCYWLTFGERFIDPTDMAVRRILGTSWATFGTSSAPGGWTDKIMSDGSGVPQWIVSGQYGSSQMVPAGTLFPDIVNSQWWKIDDTVGSTGMREIDLYEHCSEGWTATYESTHAADGLSSSPSVLHDISTRSAYVFSNPSASFFYVINQQNQLRRVQVLRDEYICAVGAPCVAPTGLRAWQRF